jgi:hypothetical protein
MGRIITDLKVDGMTPRQKAAALLPEELPPCVGVPDVPCPHPVQPVIILGYDDKPRCPACNKVHIALVEQEAGDSNPLTEPQFVTPRLNAKAEASKRRDRISKMLSLVERNQVRGGKGIPQDTSRPLSAGEAADMREAKEQADTFGTQEQGIDDDERRRRIAAKYGRKR